LKDLKPIPDKKLRRRSSHDYFAQWFISTVSSGYPLVKQDSEVEALKWFTREELFKALEETPEIFLPSMRESAEYYFNNETKR
jgi:isopentenyldiphosphate isomerase